MSVSWSRLCSYFYLFMHSLWFSIHLVHIAISISNICRRHYSPSGRSRYWRPPLRTHFRYHTPRELSWAPNLRLGRTSCPSWDRLPPCFWYKWRCRRDPRRLLWFWWARMDLHIESILFGLHTSHLNGPRKSYE